MVIEKLERFADERECYDGTPQQPTVDGCYVLHTAHRSREDALLDALKRLAIAPEYDCPGDTPEMVGYVCCLCHEPSEDGTTHKPECVIRQIEETR